MKSKIYCLILILLIHQTGNSQVWQWAEQSTGSSFDLGQFVVPDNFGNVYVGGLYTDGIISFGTLSLSSGSDEDIYLVKYDSFGLVQWTKKVGGNNIDELTGMVVDSDGNLYISVGTASSPIYFDTIQFAALIHHNYLAKYNNMGNIVWAIELGANIFDIAIDSLNNLYLTGDLDGQCQACVFGTDVLFNTVLDGSDMVIAKFDSAGNAIWGKQPIAIPCSIPGTCVSQARGDKIKLDSFGNLYVTGVKDGELVFGNDTIFGRYSLFLTKLDSNGLFLYIDTIKYSSLPSLTVEKNGTAWVGGSFNNSYFHVKDSIIQNRIPGGQNDDYLVKLNSNGDILFFDHFATTASLGAGNLIYSMANDGNGKIYINGQSNLLFYFSTSDSNGVPGLDIYSTNNCPANYVSAVNGLVYYTGGFLPGPAVFGLDTLNNISTLNSPKTFTAVLNPLIVGINEHNCDSNFLLYPNPSNNILNVSMQKEGVIYIYNLLGDRIFEIYHNKGSGNLEKIDISNLEMGTYIIKIGEASHKFIKL